MDLLQPVVDQSCQDLVRAADLHQKSEDLVDVLLHEDISVGLRGLQQQSATSVLHVVIHILP